MILRSIRLIPALFMSLLFISGCALSSRPAFNHYDADGKPVMEKRIRRFLLRDMKVRWSRKAYRKNNSSGPHFLLSAEQKAIKEEHGAPEYLSYSYLSRHGDNIKEWVYWEKGLLFQFAGRKLVYEGELTDLERTMVRYGYPDDANIFELNGGNERQNFYYNSTFGKYQMSFYFINGKCAEEFKFF